MKKMLKNWTIRWGDKNLLYFACCSVQLAHKIVLTMVEKQLEQELRAHCSIVYTVGANL